MNTVEISGWVEIAGRRIPPEELERIISDQPELIKKFGGEFFLSWGKCCARDNIGIIPGICPAGTILCEGTVKGNVLPDVPDLPLEEAIVSAVALRSDEGITALSGGVDSTLIAKLAGRECIAVGIAGSHDLRQARYAAKEIGLPCSFIEITPEEIAEALPIVVRAIPEKNPVNTGIALTQYFIAQFAGEHGYRRVITGQGADELFGGYTRYLQSALLEEDLAHDVALLPKQAARDQAVAALHKTLLSMPYLDLRVMRAAREIPACEKVQRGQRKVPLRKVAERHIPKEIAWKEKKAMQYGSGIWDVVRRLARHNGFKTSLQGYIDHISRLEHGH
ncbi:MAG: asparagine synthetase B [Methanoregula sp. PtaU1.Bin051]|nr:MAG: asparagine synthetase B [Methanoregula sp. PtaU1.Bin051]